MSQPQLLKASTLLSRLQLFRNVDIESIAECISRCEFRELQAGDILLSPDKENKSAFVVISGRLMVYLEYPDSDPLTLVEPGECVGEMSIIEGKNPSAYVVASETTQAMDIPQDVLWKMINSSHQVTRNMLHIMSLRVRFSNVVISDSMGSQKEYKRHATIDALTGLHNRRWMDSMFEQEMVHSLREDLPLCMLMLDVDYFKSHNDNFGHIAGDRVLSNVADSLRAGLRPNDMLVRFGGEEFAILLPETRLEEAMALAEKLRIRVSETETRNDAGELLPKVTISSGVTQLEKHENLLAFIDDADAALYRAKNNGRDCVSR
jgi:diguanylate cyclase (GGDEF)-like protein